MRVLIVYPGHAYLKNLSVDLELYHRGFKVLGCESVVVCRQGLGNGVKYPVIEISSHQNWVSPGYWAEYGARAALIITWHRWTEIVKALDAAGTRVLTLCDTDGMVSPRHNALATLRFLTCEHNSIRKKIGGLKNWAGRYLWARGEHQALIANSAAGHIITLPGIGPTKEFRHLLIKLGASHLSERITWLPYPVPSEFCSSIISTDRPRRLIAVGRWDSEQKDPNLLESALQRVRWGDRPYEVLIIGPGSLERFARLARSNDRIRVLGPQNRDQVRCFMAGSQIILIPSRYEGSPVVANEMLCLGGTIVGTPIPSLIGITSNGRYGQVSRRHSPAAYADAIRAELDTWDAGGRDPQAIATEWRRILNPDAVGRRALNLLGFSPVTNN